MEKKTLIDKIEIDKWIPFHQSIFHDWIGSDKKQSKKMDELLNQIRDNVESDFKEKANEVIREHYILLKDIPEINFIVKVINGLIKAEEESLKYNQDKIVNINKKFKSIEEYEQCKNFDNNLYWIKRRIGESEEEIRKWENLKILLLNHTKFAIKLEKQKEVQEK